MDNGFVVKPVGKDSKDSADCPGNGLMVASCANPVEARAEDTVRANERSLVFIL
jgi:hypothetical protein